MHVLFATDGSASARHAIHEALHMLPLRAARVDVVAVEPTLPYGAVPLGDALGAAGSPPGLADPLALAAQVHATEAVALLAEAGVKADWRIRIGDPAHEICAAADELGSDLVVLGRHGRGALGRLAFGSVSDAVVHRRAGATLVVGPTPGA